VVKILTSHVQEKKSQSPDKVTYTTVTSHWINNRTWTLQSACLDFKVFQGSITGELIYKDIVAVLQKYQGAGEDTIVLDTIGITDTTGNMGKLVRYLRDNGKEHGYRADHNLHLVAKLAFDRKIVLVLIYFPLLCHRLKYVHYTYNCSSRCAWGGKGNED
jgi:hypothetical protein